MQTKLAIAVSVAGVLAAGSAAALVNTSILDGEPEPALASAPPTSVGGRLTTFQVGQAGAVTVDLVDGRIVVPSAEPSTGWAVSSIDDDSSDGRIDVSFTDQTTIVDMAVTLAGDQFVPQVTSRVAAVATSTSPTSTSTPTSTPASTPASTSTTVAPAAPAEIAAPAPSTTIDDHGGDDADDDDDSGRGRGRGRGGDDDDDHADDD
jgi:hypothetical protein